MNNEIMKIIMEYGKKGSKIDSKFFSRILEIHFRENGISGFVDSNVVIDKDEDCPFLAGLDPRNRIIKVFLKCIIKYKQYVKEEFGQIFTLEELGLFFRMSLAQMILHEADHAIQEYARVNRDYSTPDKLMLHATNYDVDRSFDKIIASYHPDIPSESKICAIIDKEIELYRKLNDENRDLDIKERLAQINSFKTITEIVKSLDIHPNFYKFFNSEISRNQIRGYKLNHGSFAAGPTLDFIDILAKNDLIDTSISGYWDEDKNVSLQRAMSDFSFEDRINLGLPITASEFYQKTEESKKIFNAR